MQRKVMLHNSHSESYRSIWTKDCKICWGASSGWATSKDWWWCSLTASKLPNLSGWNAMKCYHEWPSFHQTTGLCEVVSETHICVHMSPCALPAWDVVEPRTGKRTSAAHLQTSDSRPRMSQTQRATTLKTTSWVSAAIAAVWNPYKVGAGISKGYWT